MSSMMLICVSIVLFLCSFVPVHCANLTMNGFNDSSCTIQTRLLSYGNLNFTDLSTDLGCSRQPWSTKQTQWSWVSATCSSSAVSGKFFDISYTLNTSCPTTSTPANGVWVINVADPATPYQTSNCVAGTLETESVTFPVWYQWTCTDTPNSNAAVAVTTGIASSTWTILGVSVAAFFLYIF